MFVKNIFRHIWPIIMKYKWSFFLTFVFYALRVLLDSVLKTVYFKKIIDVISGISYGSPVIGTRLYYLVFVSILILIGGFSFSRLGAWAIVHFQSNLMRELSDYSFQKMIKNSYHFFSNRFVGSLVTKSRR